MLGFSKTINTFLLALLFMVGGIGAAFYMWNFIDTLGTELETNLQLIKDETVLDSKYSELEKELAATAESRDALSQYVLAGEKGTIELLSQIDSLAEQLGIEVQTSKLEEVETEEVGFNELVAEFRISGSERSVMHMLELFEFLPYRSQVTTLSVSRSTNRETGLRDMQQTIGIRISITEQ